MPFKPGQKKAVFTKKKSTVKPEAKSLPMKNLLGLKQALKVK